MVDIAARTHAPRPPAFFVGRAAELRRIEQANAIRLFVIYGVAGIGKSAFTMRAAYDLAARTGARIAYVACRDGESVGTAAGVVASLLASARDSTPSGEPVQAMFHEARHGPSVLVFDDLHASGDANLLEACVHLATSDLPIWVFVVSREALPLSPAAVDHLVIQLGSLVPSDAHELWERLQTLYGPIVDGPDREGVFARCAGSPLALKQAFAGASMAGTADRLGLATLPPGQAIVITRACAYRRPMPIAALVHDTPVAVDEAHQACEALMKRFLLEWWDDKHLMMHDIVREEVLRSKLAPGPSDHRSCLDYLRRFDTRRADDGELLYHAVAAGDDTAALAILEREANQVTRIPPGTTILQRQWADAIDKLRHRSVTLPVSVRLLAARIRAGQGDSRGALDELRALITLHPMAGFAAGGVCVALGRAEEAEQLLNNVLASSNLGPLVHLLAVSVLICELRERREIARAHRILEAHAARFDVLGALGSASRSWLEGLLRYEEGRYDDAAVALEQAARTISSAAVPLSLPLLVSVTRANDAARGVPASSPPDDTLQSELFAELPFLRASARILRAEELLRRGQASAAAALATQIANVSAGTGYVRLERRARALADEANQLLTSDRADAAQRRSGEGYDNAATLLAALEQDLARGRRLAVVCKRAATLATDAHAKGWQYLACRADAVVAEAALRVGDYLPCTAALARSRATAEAMQYAGVLARIELLDRALQRTEGHEPPSDRSRAPADVAARLGLDAEVTCELSTARRRRLLTEALRASWDDSAYALVIDLIGESIKVGERRIDLRRRPAVLALAACLSADAGNAVPVSTIVRQLWQVEYRPAVHHSRATMAITRFRDLVGRSMVIASGDGYRLVLPAEWAIIRPSAVERPST